MSSRPSGAITFLFTDIEGSTRLWDRDPQAMSAALARHDAIMREQIAARGGFVFKTIGDAFCAAFGQAAAALEATVAAQRALAAEPWGPTGPIRVRMALHSGEAVERDGDYFGPTLNRVARLLATGHGGQILLSLAAAQALAGALPPGLRLRDMGERRLKDLSRPEQIFQLIAPDLPADFPPLKTLDARPTNLPAQTTALIGRERELAAVRDLLLRPQVRLVTLTGPGGTGKTRLSLQAAAELVDSFDDGVFFVALATVSERAELIPAIAQAIGLKEESAQPLLASLKGHLAPRRVLLVLDNFEQVVAAAPLLAELLAAAPALTCLVSSRIVLQLYGEHEYPVPPLALPDLRRLPRPADLAESPSVALFVERARAVRPGFRLDETNARAVAEICARLDGLPLAIELAAARVKLFQPPALLARLSSRLQLLTNGGQDRPARQQTLRAAIAWGYDLLPADEQRLFQQLAVFAGGATIEASEAVCADDGPADMLAALEALVSKSLLRQEEDAGGEPRFSMLETIREFALEQLLAAGPAEALRLRHADYYVAYAEQAEPELRGAEAERWLALLDHEHDNMRAAMRHCLEEGRVEAAVRLGGALWRYWWARGYLSEGRRWLEALVEESALLPAALRVKAISGAGVLAHTQGDYGRAELLLGQGLALQRELGDPAGIAFMLTNLGIAVLHRGDYPRAIALFEESLALRRALGDTVSVASSLNNLGLLTLYQGEYGRARGFFEETLALRRALGDTWGVANSLNNLGLAAYYQGDYEQALALCAESLTIATSLRDAQGIGLALTNRGRAALALARHTQAADLLGEALLIWHQVGNREALAECLESLAAVAAAADQEAAAARLCGAAAAIRAAIEAPIPQADRARHEQMVDTLCGRLGQQWESLSAAGAALALDQLVAYASQVADGLRAAQTLS